MATQIQSTDLFTGQWRVVSMEQWDADFIKSGEVHVEFGDNGRGVLQFGCVYGEIICWLTTRHGEPAMEWCWEGSSETIARKSQGWAVLKGNALHGMILLFDGEVSFVAERETLSSPPRKPK